MPPGDAAYLLVARKNGSNSSRRQRALLTRSDVYHAVARWSREGFNTWWLYGQRPTPDARRPLLREWQDGTTTPETPLAPPLPEPKHRRSGDATNAGRAARVSDALATYEQRYYVPRGEADATIAQDFLTDVLHWIHQRGEAASDIAQRAVNMFQEETELELDPEADTTDTCEFTQVTSSSWRCTTHDVVEIAWREPDLCSRGE